MENKKKHRIETKQHSPIQQKVLAIVNSLPEPVDNNLRFIISNNPNSELEEHANHIAWSLDGKWYFDVPEEGWRVWVDYEHPIGYNLITKTLVGGKFVDCEYIYQKQHILPFNVDDYIGEGAFWQKSITTTTIRHLEEELDPTHIVVINKNKTIGYSPSTFFCGHEGITGDTGETGDIGVFGETGPTGYMDPFDSFQEKKPFIDEDIFIIEDSQDDFQKKKTHIFSLDLKEKKPDKVLVLNENIKIGYDNLEKYFGDTGCGFKGPTGPTGEITFGTGFINIYVSCDDLATGLTGDTGDTGDTGPSVLSTDNYEKFFGEIYSNDYTYLNFWENGENSIRKKVNKSEDILYGPWSIKFKFNIFNNENQENVVIKRVLEFSIFVNTNKIQTCSDIKTTEHSGFLYEIPLFVDDMHIEFKLIKIQNGDFSNAYFLAIKHHLNNFGIEKLWYEAYVDYWHESMGR